jgi:anti-sigma factor RsiW
MDCTEARTHLLGRRRGRLDGEVAGALEDHLANCAACRHEDAADRQLSMLLEERLPRRRTPVSLRRALDARWGDLRPRRRAATAGRTIGAMLAGAALAALVASAWRARMPDDRLVSEAVNDHLRVLYETRPLEIESGGIHQVKPWFEGRLDFAPAIDFAGDDDFALEGGAIAYVVDRKAATFLFKRRLHQITLFVFRADGLRWPAWGQRAIGSAHGTVETERGFHVALWRQGDLGYALVSDVNEADLLELASRIAHP